MDATTVLVVDDNKALLQIEKTFLMRAGFAVLTAEDGDKAVELARERTPRLVLMSLQIPGKDGAVACAEMRRDAALAQTSIILMGAADSPEVRDRCARAGCTEFVVKPRKPEELLAIVARSLSITERRALRVKTRISVTGALDDQRLLGNVTNLSATGLLLLSETTMPLGSVLQLEFLVPKSGHAVKVSARVVRVGWNADGTCEAGVHFLDLDPTARERILDFTSS